MNAYARIAGTVSIIKIFSIIMVENTALFVVRITGRYEIKRSSKYRCVFSCL